MRTERQQRRADETQGKIEKYEFALKTFVALEHKLCSLVKVNVYQAKKIRRPGDKHPLDDIEVRPDMVVEECGHGTLYKAIIEIKESLSSLPENRSDVSAQLEKYRRATRGWDNDVSNMPHDVMLATGMLDAKKFVTWIKKDPQGSSLAEWLIVIGVLSIKYEDKEHIEIARIHGKIQHPKIDHVLSPEQRCRISLDDIVRKIDQMKFYDSHPPVEYTMSILWDHVFSKFLHGKKLQEFKDEKKVLIKISMTQIVDKISAFAPRSNPRCVRQRWIREAISTFKDMGIVSSKGNDEFTVTYKKHNQSTTNWIIDRITSLDNNVASKRHKKPLPDNTKIHDFI